MILIFIASLPDDIAGQVFDFFKSLGQKDGSTLCRFKKKYSTC